MLDTLYFLELLFLVFLSRAVGVLHSPRPIRCGVVNFKYMFLGLIYCWQSLLEIIVVFVNIV